MRRAPSASGFGVAPLSASLLDDPIAFLSAEHVRQTVLLAHLERLGREPGAAASPVMAAAVLRWLTEELPLHVADEEASFFPRLAAHDSAGILARLASDHRRDAGLAQAAAAALREIAQGHKPGPAALDSIAAFVRLHREHLAVEEAQVLPLARAVLGPAASRALAREMAVRRGLRDREPA